MKLIYLALLAGSALWAVSTSAQTTLTFASGAPAPAPLNRAFEQWADKVSEATDGEITINVVAGGTLGRHGQLLDRVQSGVIEMAWDFQGYYPNRFPLSSVAELPFMYSTALEGSRALQSLLDEGQFKGEYDDVVVLGMFAFPNNSVMLTQPLPESGMLDGLKMSAQNPTMYAAIEAMGGVPVSLGVPDWYPSLSRGTIDGGIIAFTAVPAFRFQEVATHYYKTSLGGNTAFAFMQRDAFDALSEDLKNDLMSVSGTFLADHMGGFLDDQAKKGEGLASTTARAIVTLDADHTKRVKDALAPIQDAWLAAGTGDQELIHAMTAAVAASASK